ncbi:mannitol dehydrogenase family protein [Streptomyces sp. ODS28]|uniref:mannitol dehydrogenase family protein n=1 Tax=Streptomyces sp. ODS28 TaxID=3136688 RepID=UPI0031EB4D90
MEQPTSTGQPPLSLAALPRLAPEQRPAVDPRELRPRVVHFGLGAFHRAHQALYTQNAAALAGEPWGVAAVAPRSAGTAEALRRQDCLYSLTERRPEGTATAAVGALVEALEMRRHGARLTELLASPDVTVVTLTVTEKGYHRSPHTGRLDLDDPGISADLTLPQEHEPATVVGRLAAGLAARLRAGGGAPITLVCCDNMAGNGAALETVLRDFIGASAWPERRALLEWMTASVAFPSTVVDRIVPAATDGDRAAADAALGVRDEVPVVGEPYRQWVLEDRFAAARPRWELDGALLVPDVLPYQVTKLRLLNGSHSALAYLGAVAGRATISETMREGWAPGLVRGLCAELAPTLPPGGPEPAAYADELVGRFGNPGMRHLLRQVGSDGSLKIPERWFGPLRHLRAGASPAPTPYLELALAAWANATRPGSDGGQLFGTEDPAAAELAACWTADTAVPAGERDRSVVRRLLGTLGAPDLAEDDALVAAVAARLPALRAGRPDLHDG